jgi:tetratricopeptide (TPR) repeat protein
MNYFKICLIVLVSFDGFSKSENLKYSYPLSDTDVAITQFNRSLTENNDSASSLAMAKYHLINGNTAKAKVELLKLKFSNGFTKDVSLRYLAIIQFIEHDYQASLDSLNRLDGNNPSVSMRTCYLKTLNQLILGHYQDLKKDWQVCKEASGAYNQDYHVWMDSFVNLKISNEFKAASIFEGVSLSNQKIESLRLILKLSLYLNQQKQLLSQIPTLSPAAFADIETRELIAMIYYREKMLVKAYRFIEDLSTPNAENLKGNIYLAQQKLELAWGQFQLALKGKHNSQNAIERSVPTAWYLKLWEEGIKLAKDLDTTQVTWPHKKALTSALHIQAAQYSQADQLLKEISVKSHFHFHPEVTQMRTIVSLMQENKDESSKYASYSCRNQDGVSCWLLYQLSSWDDFTLTLKRDDKIQSQPSLLAELLSNEPMQEFKDDVYINQKDIEELDNSLTGIK